MILGALWIHAPWTRTLSTDVNEERPLRSRRALLAELRDGSVQRIRNVVEIHLLLRKKSFVEPARNVWSVFVIHGPASADVGFDMQGQGLSAYHIVPTTLRNPQKSIDAARWTAWSGWRLLPFAVWHALRKASTASGRCMRIRSWIDSLSSLSKNALSSGFSACSPWHARWSMCGLCAVRASRRACVEVLGDEESKTRADTLSKQFLVASTSATTLSSGGWRGEFWHAARRPVNRLRWIEHQPARLLASAESVGT
jgi:hypothetical protein